MKTLSTSLMLVFFISSIHAQTFTEFDINPGGDSYPFGFTNYNGKLYFNAYTNAGGDELWVTDGTTSGTKMVKDIYPGSGGSIAGQALDTGLFTVYNNLLYLFVNDSIHGRELWSTDGTEANTKMIKDIYPGTGSSSFTSSLFYEYNGKLYFSANDGTHGYELWVTDGTSGGTTMVKDIRPGSGSSSISNVTVINGKMIFYANDSIHGPEVWTSDGTTANTVLLKDINPGTGTSFTSTLYNFKQYNGKIYFFAKDDTHGYELWTTDGTTAGTLMIKDINPGIADGNSGNIGAVYKGKMYFSANDGVNGRELWSSDGTTLGTKMVKDMYPGPNNGSPGGFVLLGSDLYIVGRDSASGVNELWVTDGTETGTRLAVDVVPGTTGASITTIFTYNNSLYFAAQMNGGRHLFKSNGTPGGTAIIAPPIATNNDPWDISSGVIEYNGAVYFRASYTTNGVELWKLVDYPASIQEESGQQLNLRIYPNPASGIVNLSFSEDNLANVSVSITDLGGRKILEQAVTEPNTALQLPTYSPGMYFVQLQTESGVMVRKVLLE